MIVPLCFRLKGIACSENGEGRSAPTRFRSNSVPIPKIEVTIYNEEETVNSSNETTQRGINAKPKDHTTLEAKIPEICIEPEDDDVFHKTGNKNLSALDGSPHHIRSASMREGLKKKRKSIIHSIEQTNVKNFKSFVRSKILSKSNMALEFEEDSTEKLKLARKSTCEGRYASSVRIWIIRLI